MTADQLGWKFNLGDAKWHVKFQLSCDANSGDLRCEANSGVRPTQYNSVDRYLIVFFKVEGFGWFWDMLSLDLVG
jgi:hypothetical protein